MNAFGSGRVFSPVTLLVLLTLSTMTLQPALGASDVVYEGTFSAGDLIWDQDFQGKHVPVLPGVRSLAQPGMPLLPCQDLLLLVPAGAKVAEAWVEPLATHLETKPGELGLGQPLAVSDGSFVTAARMAPDSGFFPASWGEFKGTHTWRGYRLLAVSVHPVREGPDGLHFLDSFAVHVRFDGTEDALEIARRERFVPGETEENMAILSELVANPERISGYGRDTGVVVAKTQGGFVPTRTPSLSGSPVDYLIITNEAMAPEFQRLADYKTARGVNTLVATREFISTNFRNGADIQETIRMFIRDAYQKWGTEFVLLGGDTDVLPARFVSNSFYPATGSTDIPVDLYFACLDGNWNANGNAFYGEPAINPDPGDEVDFAEEVYLGRATVSNPAAAGVFIDKVIDYETTEAGAQWPGRVLYASEVLFPSEYEDGVNIILDGAQFSHQMVNDLVEPCTEMERTRMYETDVLFPREAPLTREALIDSLNTGHYGIFNQIGHGFFFNMSVGNGNFVTTDADALVNENLFMLFSLNCASCAFDYSCLMERFLQNPHGGSVISIGSSRAAFPNTCNNYQQEFFSHLYCGGENRVGRLVALSRLPFLANTVYNYVDRWTFENYTLLGDPTLSLWTGIPEEVNIVPEPLELGPNEITIGVFSGAIPLQGVQVSLARAGEDQAVGVTDESGRVLLDYLATNEGEVQLTVTGPKIAMSTEMIPVANGVSYLKVLGMGIQDDGGAGSTGNYNMTIEAGETVALWPVLQETAGSGASGISGTMTCADPRVTIITDTGSFPNVSGGSEVVASTPFVVSFQADIPDGTPLVFSMTVSTAEGGSYLSEWNPIIVAPELEAVSLQWEDATYGNGDGWLDDGERVNLTVRVKNFGAGQADQIMAYLRTDNPNVVLYDTLNSYGDMELMDEDPGSTVFSLALANTTRKSESYILLVDDYGREARHDFYLQRPEAPEFIETDSSLGADVIALRWSPSISPDVLGYDVYRSTNENGPYVKANTDVVAGVAYYRDEGLDLLTRYFYKIATVDDSLVASELSLAVQQATAPAQLSGFPINFQEESSGHLAVGDIDGDGTLEVVLASDEVYVWHHDGTELMDGDNNSQTLGPLTDLDAILQPAGVVLAQLDDQPGLEIVVSDRAETQQIYVFRKDGTVLPGWPQSTAGNPGSDWNWATPAVGDVDGDGSPEIVANTVNGITWVWHADGTELMDGDNNPATNGYFYFRPGAESEWSHSSPALYDLDHDGAKDIIFGCRADGSGTKRLMALKYDGTDVPGFPYVAAGSIDNSPAIGDLNGDGVMEIVFYDWEQNLYAVQEDGTDYPGFPVFHGVGSSLNPAPSVGLGDLDEDGQLEIVLALNVSGDLGTLMAFDTDVSGGTSGTLISGWPRDVPGSSEGSPVIGDIDGDAQPDILFGIGGFSEDSPNNLYAFHADGQSIDGFPITVEGPLMSSPVITDLDHDSDVDIVYGGRGRVLHVWDMPFAYDRRNVPWPTFAGNVQRDGVIFPIVLVGVDEPEEVVPAALKVGAPYPNPFNPSTSVRLYVPGDAGRAELELVVYDIQGHRLRTLHQGAIAPGWHTLVWDGRDDNGRGQASGLYFMRARSSGVSSIQKMTLIK